MSRYNQEKAWSDFRVGLITFAGIALLVAGVILAGGDKGLLFQKISIVKARLADVGGLKKGSSVAMSGMTVGRVTEIGFSSNPGTSLVEVTMEIRSDVRPRIKKDSVPVVRTQGMLGDRYIDIFGGGAEGGELAEGDALVGDEASDFDKTLRQANEVLNETDKMLTAVNEKQGTAGQLVYDQKLYEGLTKIADQLNELIQDFKKNPRRYLKFSVF